MSCPVPFVSLPSTCSLKSLFKAGGGRFACRQAWVAYFVFNLFMHRVTSACVLLCPDVLLYVHPTHTFVCQTLCNLCHFCVSIAHSHTSKNNKKVFSVTMWFHWTHLSVAFWLSKNPPGDLWHISEGSELSSTEAGRKNPENPINFQNKTPSMHQNRWKRTHLKQIDKSWIGAPLLKSFWWHMKKSDPKVLPVSTGCHSSVSELNKVVHY